MQIGIYAPFITPLAAPGCLAAFARAAEERGFASLWVGEHVVLFDEGSSRYPYASDGRLRLPPEAGMLEPFQTLTFLAASTRRIRLGTGICLVPQRNPVYTAKAVSSLDWLSGGRFDFGVGLGWSREEFEAVGVPWEKRGERFREYVEVMRRLWQDPLSSHAGPLVRLPPCRQYPKPLQTPHPPIHIGGEGEAALRRVADLGDGWFPFLLSPAQLRERRARLHELLAERGRSPDAIRLSVFQLPTGRGMLEAYSELGVGQIVVNAAAPTQDALLAKLDALARDLVEPAAALGDAA